MRALEDFIKANKGMPAPVIEKNLGNSGSLFLARIVSWAQVSYVHSPPFVLFVLFFVFFRNESIVQTALLHAKVCF